METVQARQLLTPLQASDDFFHSDYNLNLYRGCSHGCVYCDSRSECYRLDRFDQVRVKENALAMLREELSRRQKAGLVSTGAMSDPYNPFEKELEITRGALLLLKRYGFGAGFTTKSVLAQRDADVLMEIQKNAPVRACFSITCDSDSLCAMLEPGASLTTRRFEALDNLSRAGVFAGVWLNPVLPFLTDTEENILSIVRRTKECGGQFIVCHFGMPGFVDHFGDMEKIKALPGVVNAGFYHPEMEKVEELVDSTKRIGYLLVEGKDPEDLQHKTRSAYQHLQVINPQGENLVVDTSDPNSIYTVYR